jgi:glycosyltransferase 2 family protein
VTDTARAPARRIPTGWFVRIGVSLLVLSVTLWLLPTEEVWGAVQRMPPSIWLFCLVVFLLGHVLSALKWRILIAESGEVPITRALRAHFAGLVANLALPGAAGGDVVRAGLVIRTATDKTRVAVGSLADRVVDTLSVFTLACVGAALSTGAGDTRGVVLRAGGVLLLLSVGGFAGVVVLRKIPWQGKPKKLVDKLTSSLGSLADRKGALVACFFLSLAIQAVFVGLNVLLADASGVVAPTAAWFFAWSASKLLAVLPISLGGLGVREASLAALLAPFGAPPARVVAVGLLWQSILVTSGLLGGLILLLLSRSSRVGVQASES